MAQKPVTAVGLAISQKWLVVQWLLCFAGVLVVLTVQTIATHRHGNGELLLHQHAYDNRISMLTLVAELLVLGLGLVSAMFDGLVVVVEVLFFAVVIGTLLGCGVIAWRERLAEDKKLKLGTEGSANDNKGEEAMEEGSKGPTQNTANEEKIISI